MQDADEEDNLPWSGPRLSFKDKPRPLHIHYNNEYSPDVLPSGFPEVEGDRESDMEDSFIDLPDVAMDEPVPVHDSSGPSFIGTSSEGFEDRSFNRLLVELAMEHRRSMKALRTELQADTGEASATTSAAQEVGFDQPDSNRSETSSPRNMKNSAFLRASGNFCDPRRLAGCYDSEGNMSFLTGSATTPLSPQQAPTPQYCRPSNVDQTTTLPFDVQSSEGSTMPTKGDLQILGGSCENISMWSVVPSIISKIAKRNPRGLMEKMVRAEAFDHFSGFVILLNSVLLGWSANHSVLNSLEGRAPDDMPATFQVVTVTFSVWFAIELLGRLCASGCRNFFYGEGASWNVFDCIVVGSDFIQTIIELFASHVQGGIAIQNFTAVRVLRILRITRAIRVVRLIRFFRELRMMVVSVLKSGSSLLWSLLMLSVTIYIFGIYFIQIVAYHIHAGEGGAIYVDNHTAPAGHDEVLLDENRAQERQVLEDMFGNLLKAQYTLYKAISGGVSWGEIGRELIAIHPLHGFVLCFFTFFTTFALLNIITGIFVDTSIKSAENDKEEVIQEQLHKQKRALQEMKKIFKSADEKGRGSITLDQFEKHMSQKEVRAHLHSIGIEVDKARNLFKLLDVNANGDISIEEFVFGCMRLKGAARSIDVATLMYQTRRMSEQWRHFFIWSERQFNRTHRAEKRLETLLKGLFGDDFEPLHSVRE